MINYEFLISKDISESSTDDAFDSLESLIDLSTDLKRTDGTTKALEWCKIIRARNLTPQEVVRLDYFEANAWGNRQHESTMETEAAWHWHQPEVRK